MEVLYSHIINMLIYTCIYMLNNSQQHNDKDGRRKTSFTKYLPLTLFVRFEKVTQGLRVRGSWRPNRTEIFWPPLLWPSMLCRSRSPDAQPEALGSTLLGAGFLYCILSACSLDPNSIRAPEEPFGRMWLSLPHLVYLRLQLYCNWNSNCNSTVVLNALHNS